MIVSSERYYLIACIIWQTCGVQLYICWNVIQSNIRHQFENDYIDLSGNVQYIFTYLNWMQRKCKHPSISCRDISADHLHDAIPVPVSIQFLNCLAIIALNVGGFQKYRKYIFQDIHIEQNNVRPMIFSRVVSWLSIKHFSNNMAVFIL